MAQERQSFLVRLWRGFWGLVDGTRRLVVNVIFILLLILLVRVLMDDGPSLALQDGTALVLRPYGAVVEQYSSDPLDRAIARAADQEQPETRLRDLLQAIEQAGDDSRISHLVINPDYMSSIGLASLQELSLAVRQFKESGKPVIAVADNLDQHRYYLASLADEIWLNPDGIVWIDGYSRYRNYFSEALERLEVQVNLFRVGEYKSAAEPWVRSDMSPEAREANLYWLGSLWRQYLDDVAQQRGLPVRVLERVIDDYASQVEAAGGDFAQLALDSGMVDRLVTPPDARNDLRQMIGSNGNRQDFRQVDFQSYIHLEPGLPLVSDQVAVVVAEGEIVMGPEQPGLVAAEATARQIRQAAANDRVKAVVLRVDSPGGSAFASEVIRQELQALRERGKPVVVSMGDVAASGGYWISMAADEVWSNPATITGSIGIFGLIPTLPDTLAKVGVYTDGVGTTPLAGSLRLDRAIGEDARRIIQSSVEHGYEQFLQKVSDARSLSVAEVDEVARGRVWSGQQALERSLVDQTGSLSEAIASAARKAGLGEEDYQVVWSEPELSTLDRFLLNFTAGLVARFDLAGDRRLERLLDAPLVRDLLSSLERLADGGGRTTVYAHCLCTLP